MGVRYMDMVTRHTKSTVSVKTCLFSSLLTGIGVSDFFDASCAEGQLSPSLSVSHRRSQFLCGLFLDGLRSGGRSSSFRLNHLHASVH